MSPFASRSNELFFRSCFGLEFVRLRRMFFLQLKDHLSVIDARKFLVGLKNRSFFFSFIDLQLQFENLGRDLDERTVGLDFLAYPVDWVTGLQKLSP